MAFEGLSEKLNQTFKRLRGKGRIAAGMDADLNVLIRLPCTSAPPGSSPRRRARAWMPCFRRPARHPARGLYGRGKRAGAVRKIHGQSPGSMVK